MKAPIRRSTSVVAALVAAILLASCSKPADEPRASANVSFEDDAPPAEPRPDPAPVERAPVPEPANITDDEAEDSVPPPAQVSRDAQMLDDADASGMTARLPADDDASTGGDQDDVARP